MTRVYLGLGSNLADPARQVRTALRALQDLSDQGPLRASPLYANPPLGPAQPDYVNAVAEIQTSHTPWSLLAALQAIEQVQGRVRTGVRWGPRVLDLDILLFGDMHLQTPALQLPHPGLRDRAFVLRPLLDLCPDLSVPGWGPLADCLATCPAHVLERLPS